MYEFVRFDVNKHFFFSSRRRHTRSVSAFLLNRSSDLNKCLGILLVSGLIVPRKAAWSIRSEERRVGKECRSRASPYQKKKKKRIIGQHYCRRTITDDAVVLAVSVRSEWRHEPLRPS